MRIALGPVADLSDRKCVAAGAAIVVRTGATVVAYRNQCLHQDSPLEGAWVRDGVISCPLHFWRYDVNDGSHIGSDTKLEQFPVEITDGDAFVTVPDPVADLPWRERQLARAATYDRTSAFLDQGSNHD